MCTHACDESSKSAINSLGAGAFMMRARYERERKAVSAFEGVTGVGVVLVLVLVWCWCWCGAGTSTGTYAEAGVGAV